MVDNIYEWIHDWTLRNIKSMQWIGLLALALSGALFICLAYEVFSPKKERSYMPPAKKIVFEYVDDRSSKLPLPEYKTKGAAGFDFYCAQDESALEGDADIRIPCGYKWIRTGIRAKIPVGHYIEVVPRSSSLKKGLLIFKGTIDEDYHGEIKIGVFNPTNKPVYLEEGDRIAQGILHKCVRAKLEEGEVPAQVRGGFGSTGK